MEPVVMKVCASLLSLVWNQTNAVVHLHRTHT